MQNKQYKKICCKVSISNSLCSKEFNLPFSSGNFWSCNRIEFKIFYPNTLTVYPCLHVCLWSKIIRKVSSAHHKSFFSWKVEFLSLKKRPNINLHVEYSRTYDFSRILSSFIRQLNFTQNDLCAFSDNICYVKLEFQILYAAEQLSSLFSR